MLAEIDNRSPAITVVIPVYNGTQYLAEAIDSVLAQTYRDFEIIVVDDGSTDDTWHIIEAYIAAHPQIVRGIRKANGGISTALNAGIHAAKGQYVAWLSHDDRFIPTKLEKQIALLKHNRELAGVYSDYVYIDDQSSCVGYAFSPWYPRAEMLRHLLQHVYINGSTLLIKRHCLLDVGAFDETLRYAQDAMMWVYIGIRYPLAHIPEPLTEYRLHLQQTSTTTKKHAIRRDSRTWLSRAVTEYTIQQIFPELNKPDTTPVEFANAYLYFGEVFAIQYHHILLSIQQFWRAWRIWPTYRNPVLTRAGLAALRALKSYLLTPSNHRRFGKNIPNSNRHLLVTDMRSWSEAVSPYGVKQETN